MGRVMGAKCISQAIYGNQAMDPSRIKEEHRIMPYITQGHNKYPCHQSTIPITTGPTFTHLFGQLELSRPQFGSRPGQGGLRCLKLRARVMQLTFSVCKLRPRSLQRVRRLPQQLWDRRRGIQGG